MHDQPCPRCPPNQVTFYRRWSHLTGEELDPVILCDTRPTNPESEEEPVSHPNVLPPPKVALVRVSEYRHQIECSQCGLVPTSTNIHEAYFEWRSHRCAPRQPCCPNSEPRDLRGSTDFEEEA